MIRTLPALALLAFAAPAFAQIQDLDEPIPTMPGNPAVEAQMKGQFPKESRPATPTGEVQPAWAKADKKDGIRAGQEYDPTKRVDLVLRDRVTTTIAIPEWDNIDETVLSDQTHFGVKRGKKPWMLHVWPKAPGADGNLTIIGESGLWYLFRLVGHTGKSDQVPDIFYGLSAPAPKIDAGDGKAAGTPTPAAARVAAKSEDWLFNIPFDPAKLKRDLTMNGDEGIAPVWVARDEYRTFLFYDEKPDVGQGVAIWKVQDRIDQQVNWQVSPDRRVIVVFSTGPLTVRNGQRTVCIRPKA